MPPGNELLRRELEELRGQSPSCASQLHDLSARQQQMQDDVRTLKDALGDISLRRVPGAGCHWLRQCFGPPAARKYY